MSTLDWAVLVGTLALIVVYGVWKTRGAQSMAGYLRGGSDAKWWTIGLSIMATQASAITFLSTPGQGFDDGLGFLQFYFGVPIAMVVLSATILPIYYRTRVLTAYEYLEQRFDLKTRQLTALIFLVQRGLGAGLSLYAPAIILSAVLGWSVTWTTVVLGVVVIAYTVFGGTRAVNQTQQLQMVVMLSGMWLAFAFALSSLPPEVSLLDAARIAGALGKLEAVTFEPSLETRYTFWSGITGGTFVALAYFGTDQSQVQRYLSGESLTQSRLGTMFNALLKVPMQLMILSVGVVVFVFFQFERSPVFWNAPVLERVRQSPQGEALTQLETTYDALFEQKRAVTSAFLAGDVNAKGELQALDAQQKTVRAEAKKLVAKAEPSANTKDADYVFLTFVMTRFPRGLIGLLLAVILAAAMSATASALNALGTTSMVDFYKRSIEPTVEGARGVAIARWLTVVWGVIAIGFSLVASRLENLIQATNILGSLFYGPMLGVFVVGFFVPKVKGTPVFIAALVAQALVIATFLMSSLGYLWFNVIGCVTVVGVAVALNAVRGSGEPSSA